MSKILKNTDINNQIYNFWSYFKLLPNSEYIASCSALKAIYCQSIVSPPHRILEFGTGIGTISAFLLSSTKASVVTIEKDSDFSNIARNNIDNFFQKDFTKRLDIEYYKEFSQEIVQNYDWVVIDGSVSKSEWQQILKLNSVELFIIENQRFISRFRVLNILFRNRLRYQYSEIDTNDETGIAAFRINSRGRHNFLLFVLDYLSTLLLLLPRFAKGIVDTRGRNLLIND